MVESIRIEKINKSFGSNRVIDNVSLSIETGRFVTLLGPSGCGKTTLLRCLAGLETPDKGKIFIGDRLVFSADEVINVPAKARGLSMVFQTYAVWPHMTVFENVSFGLRLHKVSKPEIEQRVTRMLEITGILDLAQRFPFEVSGGQQQRISLARALVVEPVVLLMDEPLSNLDARLRMVMRTEIKRIHREMGTTIIYVTHDQLEALTMSDEVVVMKDGKIQQIADPLSLYDFPDNIFVSNFIGTLPINLIDATIASIDAGNMRLVTEKGRSEMLLPQIAALQVGDKIAVAIRPEDIVITKAGESEQIEDSGKLYELSDIQCIGSTFIVRAKRNGLELTIEVEKQQSASLKYGEKVYAEPVLDQIRLYDKSTGTLIRG